jgi:hypothetical protein
MHRQSTQSIGDQQNDLAVSRKLQIARQIM